MDTKALQDDLQSLGFTPSLAKPDLECGLHLCNLLLCKGGFVVCIYVIDHNLIFITTMLFCEI